MSQRPVQGQGRDVGVLPVPAHVSEALARLASEPGALTQGQVALMDAYLRAHTPVELVNREKQGLTADDWQKDNQREAAGLEGHRLVFADRAIVRCNHCDKQAAWCFYERFVSPSGRSGIHFDYRCETCGESRIAQAVRLRAETQRKGGAG